jgi:hypothetical protein
MSEQKPIQWTNLVLPLGNGETDKEPTDIQVSNEAFSVPVGLTAFHNFMSEEESIRILEETDERDHIWEGFDQRRKVQRYSLQQSDLPPSLHALAARFAQQTGYTPDHISVEEYPKSQLQKHFTTNLSTVTTFETPARCKCEQGSCSCFVGVVPICCSVIQNINRPLRRFSDCWDLFSPNHWTGLILNARSLFVNTDEMLWEWRTRINTAGPDAEPDSRFVLIKIYNLPASSLMVPGSDTTEFDFGYMPNPEHDVPGTTPMPPLQELLTVIVTTSPIRSNPSTELLERVFETFRNGGHDFAYKCRKLIVCDGCRQRTEATSKRHNNVKQSLRNGIVDSEQLERYAQFKAALRELCANASEDSLFCNTSVEELEVRQGYGFALRHCLRECVSTPYVIVIQHDRTFMRPTPIYETVKAMWQHPNIKYVGMSMRSNLLYRDQFLGKYGKSYMPAMSSCILRPPALMLDACDYGPNSHSTENMEYSGNELLRENIQALSETYSASQQNIDHVDWTKSNPLPPGKWQLSLTPTFFWYDNVHICETAHYRDFIYNPKFKMVVKGGFVEDKLSPVLKKTVERFGLVEGHARFGCFLLDDHSGMFFTGHLDGGTYLGEGGRERKLEQKKRK